MTAEVEKYASLLRLAPFGCLVVIDGVVKAANTEAIEVTGVPLGRLLGVELRDLLVPEFHEPCDDALAGANGTTRRLAVRLARALAPVELNVRASADNENVAIVGVRSMESEYRLSARSAGELTHDQVTGLPDRYQLLSLFHERMNVPRRSTLALVALWVDDLGQLSETKGEGTADRIVREVGERIQARLRSPDVIGRLDHDGFLSILTSDAPTAQLTEIADRLRGEVAFPVDVENSLISFTASVAVASLQDRQPSIERALAQLEAAANRARNSSGNRTEVLEL
ncbi:MAG: GGDEF domain-containing protein [Acidimicrobiales bacterium]